MTALQLINEQMTALDINYEFGEWTSVEIPKLYFIGTNYHEDESSTDDMINSTLTVVSHNRSSFKDFFNAIDKIKKRFDFHRGLRVETGSGHITIFYSGHTLTPPQKIGERTKAEIKLRIKENKSLK